MELNNNLVKSKNFSSSNLKKIQGQSPSNQSDFLIEDFFAAIEASKKIIDKKKKIDELSKYLEENPSYLKSPRNQPKISQLYDLMISNLNENNNSYISSQIKLIDILINNNKNNNNNQTFINFSKMALPKLFDKYYLQNQKINESLTGILSKFINYKILNIQDYYTHIENISLEEEDNYRDNIMNLLNEQIGKNKEITIDKVPKGIADIIKKISEDSENSVSDKAKHLLNIFGNRENENKIEIEKKTNINDYNNKEDYKNNELDNNINEIHLNPFGIKYNILENNNESKKILNEKGNKFSNENNNKEMEIKDEEKGEKNIKELNEKEEQTTILNDKEKIVKKENVKNEKKIKEINNLEIEEIKIEEIKNIKDLKDNNHCEEIQEDKEKQVPYVEKKKEIIKIKDNNDIKIKINNNNVMEKENENDKEIEVNQINNIPEIKIDENLLDIENIHNSENKIDSENDKKIDIKDNNSIIANINDCSKNNNQMISNFIEKSNNVKEDIFNNMKTKDNLENILKKEKIEKNDKIKLNNKNEIVNENILKETNINNKDLIYEIKTINNNTNIDNINKIIQKEYNDNKKEELLQTNKKEEYFSKNEFIITQMDTQNNKEILNSILYDEKLIKIIKERKKESTNINIEDKEKKLDKNEERRIDNDDINNNMEENSDHKENYKAIQKKESNNDLNENNEKNQETKKESGVKRSSIQGKLNKFRKQFGKSKNNKNIEKTTKNENKADFIIKNNSNNLSNNLEDINLNQIEKNIINEKKSKTIINNNIIKIKEEEELYRTNTLEEMFKKKIEDGFDTETNNILDLGKSHNNIDSLNILNEIQDRLGIDFNEINNNSKKTNINLETSNNFNNNINIKQGINDLGNKEINHGEIKEKSNTKNKNIQEIILDSKKIINPDDRPIHPSISNNYNFDLDFNELEILKKKEPNNKDKKIDSHFKNFFENKDLVELCKINNNINNIKYLTDSDNNSKNLLSYKEEYNNKKINEIHPFNIDNDEEIKESDITKDKNELNNINIAINNINNTINNLQNLNIIKINEEDERRPKIKVEDFQKKLELALEQEQERRGSIDIGGNKDNNIENENKNSSECIEDPRFDNIKAKLGKKIVDSLISKKWEDKKYGYELINNFIESNSLNDINSNDLYEYIRFKLKNFKETNFNVNREALNVFEALTKKKFINKENLIFVIIAYYDKITDPKLKDNYLDLLKSSFLLVEPNFILKNILLKISKKNNARLFIEYSLLFGKIIENYNNKELPYKEMTDFCKIMANNSNLQCRNASINLICILYKYYGEEIHKLIKDIKESTLKNIEAEMSKITIIERKTSSNVKVKRYNRKLSVERLENKNTNLNGGEKGLNGAANIDIKSNAPFDISKKITAQILKNISDGKWADKKDACEKIEKVLEESNMEILPNGLNELMNLIKKKLADRNKNVVRMMVNLLTQLIEALKQGFNQWSKYIALNLIPHLSDKNQVLRNECQICFSKWVEYVGFDSLIIYFPQFLKNGNVEIRTEIMNFIKTYKDKFNKEIGVLVFKEMIENLLLCLQDRTSSVRIQAEETIKFSLNYIKLNAYYTKIKEYKPTITNDLKIILDKIQNEIKGGDSSDIKEGYIISKENINSTSSINNDENNNSNNKENIKKMEEYDYENESNININEIINSNNNKNYGNGALSHKSNKNNSKKKKNDSYFLKSNSSILNSGSNLNISRKSSINSKPADNKKFKKSKNKLKNSIVSDRSQKEKDFKEKATKTKDLATFKGSFKTCTNFNKKKKTFNKNSPNMKSAKKDEPKLLKSNEKEKVSEKSILAKSVNVLNMENPKSERTYTTKKLGISNSLILKKNEAKTIKKEGNSIFLRNVKVPSNKSKRLEKDIKFKFSLDNVSSDNSIKAKLQDTCKHIFTDEFNQNIFSNDFKKQFIALKEMKEQLDKKINIQKYLDNLDLILKIYGVYLIGNLNPTLVKNLFEFLNSLYNIINDKRYLLNEIESNIIITLLIDKLSINNNTLKEYLIKLLNEYIELNDINKNMILVLNIALKKNSKIKTDILDFTIELCANKKLNIMTKNYIKIFGKYISSNDNLVKVKVLILFKQIFSVIGEELFIILDFLSDKDKKFLESNLFADNDQDDEEEIEIGNQHYFGIDSSDEEFDSSNQKGDNNSINPKNIIANGAVSSNNELLSLMNNLLSKDQTERVNSIILVHEMICQKFQENKSILIPNIDNIINIFIKVTHEIFIGSNINFIHIKFAKYLSTVFLKIATNKELISNISFNILYKLTIELLSYLLIKDLDKIGVNQEGNFIFKSINSTMLRVIDNCDKTSVILVFLEILKNYQKNDDKIGGLAVKCLLKSTENLYEIISGLNIPKIFIELNVIINNYEKIYPDLKQVKNQADTVIIRFIKNFICNVAKLKEDTIFEIYNNSFQKTGMEDKYILYWIKNTIERIKLSDKSLYLSINNDNTLNSIEINSDNDKNKEEKKEDVKINNIEKNSIREGNNNNVNIKVNDNNNTIDQLKKKWNELKIK